MGEVRRHPGVSMSAGGLVLVCRATGERLPIEELRRHGFVISIETIRTEHVFAVPHKADAKPPCFSLEAPEGVDAVEFFDRINGAVIAACKASQS